MMRDELGYGADSADPFRAALATFGAFIALGALPLLVFVVDLVLPADVPSPFAWSAALAAVAFLGVGTLKGRVVGRPPWRSALETLVIGGAAAALAFLAGLLLQSVA
jgi:VIT1/CCC1 family predicted Fe2+/Mn2+ transporter